MNRQMKWICTVAAIMMTLGAVRAETIFNSINNAGTDSGIAISGKGINFTVPAGQDVKLSSVDLSLGSVGSSATVIVSIWSDDGTSAPLGTLLEALTNPATITADSVNTFTSSGLTLTAGATYWLVAQGSGSGAANIWYWKGSQDAATTGTNTVSVYGSGTPSDWSKSSSVLNAAMINASSVRKLSLICFTTGY
jgi:hypothetical protein